MTGHKIIIFTIFIVYKFVYLNLYKYMIYNNIMYFFTIIHLAYYYNCKIKLTVNNRSNS